MSAAAHDVSRKWVAAYRGWNDAYRLASGSQIARRRRRDPFTLIRRYTGLGAGARVLEVGCGGGAWGLCLATFGCTVVLSDLSGEVLRSADANRKVVAGHFGEVDVALHRGDLFAIGLAEGSFDLTMNEGVLEHFLERDDRVRGVREMARVTRTGGHVVIGIPNNVHPFSRVWEAAGWPWTRPGFDLQEVVLSSSELKGELQDAGLVDVATDGYEVYHSLDKHPRWLPQRMAAQLLKNMLPPPPRAVRLTWGTYLLAVGRKP